MHTDCVLCELRIKLLYIIYTNAVFQSVNQLLDCNARPTGVTISQASYVFLSATWATLGAVVFMNRTASVPFVLQICRCNVTV